MEKTVSSATLNGVKLGDDTYSGVIELRGGAYEFELHNGLGDDDNNLYFTDCGDRSRIHAIMTVEFYQHLDLPIMTKPLSRKAQREKEEYETYVKGRQQIKRLSLSESLEGNAVLEKTTLQIIDELIAEIESEGKNIRELRELRRAQFAKLYLDTNIEFKGNKDSVLKLLKIAKHAITPK